MSDSRVDCLSGSGLVDILVPILTALLGGVLTYFLGPRVAESFQLRRSYLAPFREWCSRSYGELLEFKERYIDSPRSPLSPLLVILDFWELHEKLAAAPRWLGRISKEDPVVFDDCWELIHCVDSYWHDLEHRYKKLPVTKDPKVFEWETKTGLTIKQRGRMADEIWEFLDDNKSTLSSARFNRILQYFLSQVPGGGRLSMGEFLKGLLFAAIAFLIFTFPATWLLMLFFGNIGVGLSYWDTFPLGILVSALLAGVLSRPS